jgi:hypothetical protein
MDDTSFSKIRWSGHCQTKKRRRKKLSRRKRNVKESKNLNDEL